MRNILTESEAVAVWSALDLLRKVRAIPGVIQIGHKNGAEVRVSPDWSLIIDDGDTQVERFISPAAMANAYNLIT